VEWRKTGGADRREEVTQNTFYPKKNSIKKEKFFKI